MCGNSRPFSWYKIRCFFLIVFQITCLSFDPHCEPLSYCVLTGYLGRDSPTITEWMWFIQRESGNFKSNLVIYLSWQLSYRIPVFVYIHCDDTLTLCFSTGYLRRDNPAITEKKWFTDAERGEKYIIFIGLISGIFQLFKKYQCVLTIFN